jgi:predicted N-acetyltransferase YhbS
MQIEIIHENQIKPELDEAIKNTLCICFQREQTIFSRTRAWNGNEPVWTFYMEQDGKVIAHLSFSDQNIQVENRYFHVAGVQNVCVLPDYRGQGLSRQLSQAAMQKARELQYDFGLLFTGEWLIEHYTRAGWKHLLQRTIIQLDDNCRDISISDDQNPMYYPLALNEFPAGSIHLQSRIW